MHVLSERQEKVKKVSPQILDNILVLVIPLLLYPLYISPHFMAVEQNYWCIVYSVSLLELHQNTIDETLRNKKITSFTKNIRIGLDTDWYAS